MQSSELHNIKFHNFLLLYTQKEVLTKSARKKFYVDACNEAMINNIRQRVFYKNVWISIDETTALMEGTSQMP